MDETPRIVDQLDWRDLPENVAGRTSEYRLRGWLEDLAKLWDRYEEEMFKALYEAAYAISDPQPEDGLAGQLEADRRAAQAARRALRLTQHAALQLVATLRLGTRLEYRELAHALGVSESTVRDDRALLALLLRSGCVDLAASGPLGPLPHPAADHVVSFPGSAVSRSGSRRRRMGQRRGEVPRECR